MLSMVVLLVLDGGCMARDLPYVGLTRSGFRKKKMDSFAQRRKPSTKMFVGLERECSIFKSFGKADLLFWPGYPRLQPEAASFGSRSSRTRADREAVHLFSSLG